MHDQSRTGVPAADASGAPADGRVELPDRQEYVVPLGPLEDERVRLHLILAAIGPAHRIDDAAVVLRRCAALPGTAIDQLQRRLLEAVRALGCGIPDDDEARKALGAAVLGQLHRVDMHRIVVRVRRHGPRNALGQLDDRLFAAYLRLRAGQIERRRVSGHASRCQLSPGARGAASRAEPDLARHTGGAAGH